VEEWTAREDLRHRLWALRASVERYLRLQQEQIASIRVTPPRDGYTLSQQKLNSDTDIHIEAVLTNAKHLSRALQSPHLPTPLKGLSLGSLDLPLHHVRNIREHWDENRVFWSEPTTPPKGTSVRWFKTNFPDKTPWSSGWSNVDGPVICGIIPLRELVSILDQLEASIGAP
jgi:hypothetical protein